MFVTGYQLDARAVNDAGWFLQATTWLVRKATISASE